MLEEMSTAGDESVVSWQPHGKAFRVHRPDVFARTVMPRYFKQQTKYKSFLRQLHIYGFQRIGKGMDRGAYFHSMFIQNKKSMSLCMSCTKIKGKKSGDAALRHAAVDPDFYSSEKNVDMQNLTNVLQSGPKLHAFAPMQDNMRGCSKRGSTTALTSGDEKLLFKSALLFNQEVADGSSPSPQIIGSEMDQAKTIISRAEEQASPYPHAVSKKEGHDASSAVLYGLNHEKQGDESFFEGKRFFCVAETKTFPMVEDFNALINRGGPIFYMPRSA
jgi:hypothetical protein